MKAVLATLSLLTISFTANAGKLNIISVNHQNSDLILNSENYASWDLSPECGPGLDYGKVLTTPSLANVNQSGEFVCPLARAEKLTYPICSHWSRRYTGSKLSILAKDRLLYEFGRQAGTENRGHAYFENDLGQLCEGFEKGLTFIDYTGLPLKIELQEVENGEDIVILDPSTSFDGYLEFILAASESKEFEYATATFGRGSRGSTELANGVIVTSESFNFRDKHLLMASGLGPKTLNLFVKTSYKIKNNKILLKTALIETGKDLEEMFAEPIVLKYKIQR